MKRPAAILARVEVVDLHSVACAVVEDALLETPDSAKPDRPTRVIEDAPEKATAFVRTIEER